MNKNEFFLLCYRITGMNMKSLPSQVDLFCKDERAHDGNYDHHQRTEGRGKDWPSALHHQSLDIVCNARCDNPLQWSILPKLLASRESYTKVISIERERERLTAYAAARRFISQPIFQTEGLCSITSVTAMACRVPIKQINVVRES